MLGAFVATVGAAGAFIVFRFVAARKRAKAHTMRTWHRELDRLFEKQPEWYNHDRSM